MEKVTTETPAQEAEENEVDVNEVTAPPPSLAQLYTMFRPIQESAFLCNLPDASSHLQRALHVFREAIRKSKRNRTMANAHYGNASETSLSFSSHKVLPTRVSANSE